MKSTGIKTLCFQVMVLTTLAAASARAIHAQRPPGGWVEDRFGWETNGGVDHNENPPCSHWSSTARYVFTTAPGNLDLEVFIKPLGTSADSDVCYDVSLSDVTTNHRHGILRPTIGKLSPRTKGRGEQRQSYTESSRYSIPEEARIMIVIQTSGRFSYRIRLKGPKAAPEPPSPAKPQ
jgi:hypothetical protein